MAFDPLTQVESSLASIDSKTALADGAQHVIVDNMTHTLLFKILLALEGIHESILKQSGG